jgi:hypothetical protein
MGTGLGTKFKSRVLFARRDNASLKRSFISMPQPWPTGLMHARPCVMRLLKGSIEKATIALLLCWVEQNTAIRRL